ncbi:hypothetical protein BJ878DRAFT_511522 [Calycina marina]|uniref:protein disulfide-isomerase n=1 Tax=Calycina marina TaxID=1763456 RepID=A0A9P7Z1C9_9HELO|nr:hypothetical protein BJ878DRAFT_511522 [Calycina marina]
MVNAGPALALAATAFFTALPVHGAGLYPKSSAVIQVDGKNYDRLIAQSNYTSIVEFYAPWCGHCKNLQPAYEKAAKSLTGLAKVAAVNCDEESNKQFCGSMGVQGFPTLKIVKPSKKAGKSIVEDYNGPRTAKGIVESMKDKIPNYVKKINDDTITVFLEDNKETPKAVLFTKLGKTSDLMKSIAIEFKDTITVAQIRDKETTSASIFKVEKFPALLLLPANQLVIDPIWYNGELNKAGIVEFLTEKTSITAHPDPATPKVKVKKPKEEKAKKPKEEETEKEELESESASQAFEEGSGATVTDETLVDEATPSPNPIVEAEKPIIIPDPTPPIGLLSTAAELAAECLGPKTGTCILALLPGTPDAVGSVAAGSLAEIAHKHKLSRRHIFPFYVVPELNEGYAAIKKALDLEHLDIIAINGKRGWWRRVPLGGDKLSESDVTEEALEDWVDAIRLGEGAKSKLPAGLVPEEPEELEESAPIEPETLIPEETPEVVNEEEPVAEKTADIHHEL